MKNPEQLIRQGRRRKGAFTEGLIKALLGGMTWGVVAIALLFFGRICWDGAPVLFKKQAPFIDTAFLTHNTETLHVFDDASGNRYSLPAGEFNKWEEQHGGSSAVFNEQTFSYSGGGIAGPIVGTALLTLSSVAIALFFGVAAAIYLSEYARQGRFINLVRLAILNLAGVPSIVFGLFGMAVFVLAAPIFTSTPGRSLLVIPLGFTNLSFEGWKSSLIAGAATLACMILPVIITASEESLRAVPHGFREASLALGATRWQTIRKSVLPFALPGILTSSVLSLARAAGETAPIMFTAAVAAKDGLPWDGLVDWSHPSAGQILTAPFRLFGNQVQALPYHIYTLTKLPASEYAARAQYGSIFVFLVMILLFSSVSMILRNRVRSKLKW